MFTFFAALAVAALPVMAQSVSVIETDGTTTDFNTSTIESLNVSETSLLPEGHTSSTVTLRASWASLGTSITWYNNNVSSSNGRFTKGYQDRVMQKLHFQKFTNLGLNGKCLIDSYNGTLVKADYYTIEHGINDWGHSTKVGTIDDYINDTGTGTFAGTYRKLIDKIYKTNAKAKIILCTPRKAYGFSGYLPDHWYDAYNGIYLQDYADLIKQIAAYESLPVADFFYLCGNQHNLASLSIDTALHPNDDGYQMMANVLLQAFQSVMIH